jgi:hypothetical protein
VNSIIPATSYNKNRLAVNEKAILGIVANGDAAYVPNDLALNDGPYFAPHMYQALIHPYARSWFAKIRGLRLLGDKWRVDNYGNRVIYIDHNQLRFLP